jgi:indole-3-glycerol phosphate synthase
MHHKLAKILVEKQKEVAALKANFPCSADSEPHPRRDFKAAIAAEDRINLIAEIKFASPSAGLISTGTDPVAFGRIYEKAGAAAVSLITDRHFFQGDPGVLPRLKKAVALPVLRKDFIIDETQVRESRCCGADALLLIVRILTRRQLAELICMCREFHMTPLTEIHDERDLDKALACGAEIIGINNRDLDTFEIDTRTTLELAPLVPNDCIVVSESGIENAEDIVSIKKAGIHAVLVGTALMRNNDPAAKTEELVRAGMVRND